MNTETKTLKEPFEDLSTVEIEDLQGYVWNRELEGFRVTIKNPDGETVEVI